MDKKIINENLLIERYLKDTLSVKEREAYEEQFLSSDELLDELGDVNDLEVHHELWVFVLEGVIAVGGRH